MLEIGKEEKLDINYIVSLLKEDNGIDKIEIDDKIVAYTVDKIIRIDIKGEL
ncbi:MAG: hypothetical protein ACOC4G_12970 [Bacillota bacterium]